MKKILLIIICVLWLLAGVQVIQSREEDKQEKIMEVLGRVGTMEQSSIVEYEGIVLEKIEKEQAFLEEILYVLELTAESYETISYEDSCELLASAKEGTLRLVTRTGEEGNGQYVFVKLDFQEDTEAAFAVRKKLEDLLKPYLRTIQSSVNIIGSLKGELSLERRNRAADELLQELEAEVVTEHRSMELFTIYGYTPYIEEYKLQKNQAVNVNIAMYYNEEEDRTYIYAAVPVIGVEY